MGIKAGSGVAGVGGAVSLCSALVRRGRGCSREASLGV